MAQASACSALVSEVRFGLIPNDDAIQFGLADMRLSLRTVET